MKALLFASLLCAGAAAAHEGHKHPASALGLNPAWDKLKTLAGEWRSEDGARVRYELVSGGTTLMETIDVKGEPAMVTMYHPDGDAVLMSHYCADGSLPRMRTTGFDKSGDLEFELVDVANLSAPDVERMDGLVLGFPGKDALVANWASSRGPKTKKAHTVFRLTRAAASASKEKNP